MRNTLSYDMLEKLEKNLRENEKSRATIENYLRDVRKFITFAKEGTVLEKETVLQFKDYLQTSYEITSANSMLAAVNCFLRYIGREDCMVKAFKVQAEAFRTKERELTKNEYFRLLNAAKTKGDERLYWLMQTICSTGIRVSELQFITVESLYTRRTRVDMKGKSRTVILPRELSRGLHRYVRENHIHSGCIFVTRNGRPMDRSNILHAMKKLCNEAEVPAEKVFPHNLRHLFAVTFYREEKDIMHLADILGHSDINTTRIYTMISCEEQEKALDRLGLCIDKKRTA